MLTVNDLLKICAEFEKKAQYTALDTTLEKGVPEYRGYEYGKGQIPFNRYVHFPQYKELHPEFPIPKEKEEVEEKDQLDPYDPSTTLPLPGMVPPAQPKELDEKYDQDYYASHFRLPEIEPYHIQPQRKVPETSGGYGVERDDIDKPLDEIRTELLERYDNLKKSLAILFEKYKEANQRAAESPELNVENLSLVETIQSLTDYCISKIRWAAGRMFGDELGTNSQLFSFLTKNFNIFGVSNLNFQQYLQKFNLAEKQINDIIAHYEKLKRMEKIVAKNVQQSVNEFLSKQENIDILIWTDQHNPEAKKQIVEEMKKSLQDSRWRRRSKWQRDREDFSLNDLRSIRTFKEIYEKLSSTLTSKIKLKAVTKGEEHIRAIVHARIKPILDTYLSHFSWLKSNLPDDKNLIDEIFIKLKMSLKEVLGLDIGSVEQYLKMISPKRTFSEYWREPEKTPYNVVEVVDSFKLEFVKSINEFLKRLDRSDSYFIQNLTNKFFDSIDKRPVELIGQEISKFIDDQKIEASVKEELLDEIVGKIPGIDRPSKTTPGMSEIKNILLERGNINFKSIIDILKQNIPEFPDNLLVMFVKYLFREDEIKSLENIKKNANKFGFLLKLLSKFNKLDINNLVKLLPKFTNIIEAMNTMSSDLPETIFPSNVIQNILLKSIRNLDTIDVDLKNIEAITKIIHNEGSNISPEIALGLFNNVNISLIGKVAGIKKLYKAIVSIANIGGPKGLKKQHGPLITELVKSKLVSRNIYSNMQFLLDFFNSNQAVNPSSANFADLFRITSEVETDLDAVLMADTYKEFLKDYEPKNPALFKLDYKINDRLRFRVLKDKDPRHLRVGIETDCCQRIGGVGETAAIDSFVNPLAGVLILEWLDDEGKWKLVSQSYFHYVPDENGYILDNVEGNNKNIYESKIDLPSVYAWYANKMKRKLKFNYFLSGKGYTELDHHKFETDSRDDDNRDFSDKALVGNRTDHYSDYDEENSSDLTKPKFKLKKLDPKSWGQTTVEEKEIENKIASSISNIRRIILRSYLIAA